MRPKLHDFSRWLILFSTMACACFYFLAGLLCLADGSPFQLQYVYFVQAKALETAPGLLIAGIACALIVDLILKDQDQKPAGK